MIVMACYGLHAGAQVRQNSNFIYLYSDSIVYANSIRLRPDFSNVLQLRVDQKRYAIQQVKFFNNEDGFFANTKKLSPFGISEFCERIIEGRINFFRQVTYDSDRYDRGYRLRNRRQDVVDIRMFYNKGYGDLKKANYANLMQDMADRTESMDLLASYRKKRNTSTILYVAAGASLVASLVSFVSTGKQKQDLPLFNGNYGRPSNFNDNRSNFAPSFGLMGAGLGLAVAGYLVGLQGSRQLENAVDAYNK